MINLQPFSDLPAEYLDFVYRELKNIYPSIVIKKPIALPASALNLTKTRFRADSLIRMLSRNTPEGELTIGLTTKDISTTKGKIADWGVMGLGFCPGKSCVASSFRLNKKNIKIQLFKTSIHELSHTQGLPHCPVKNCFMRDAEGKNHKDEETGFCDSCKAVLISHGWNLK